MAISLLIENSCKSCTAKCCRGLAVVLTIPEARRMVAELGMAPQEFMEFSDRVDPKGTPHYPLLVKSGSHVRKYYIILRKKEKFDCVFLNKDMSCSVYNHRPHVCRLYPFELDGKKMKKGALCPVKFEREGYVDKVAQELKKDLSEHGKLARAWAVKYEGGMPDISKFGEYFG